MAKDNSNSYRKRKEKKQRKILSTITPEPSPRQKKASTWRHPDRNFVRFLSRKRQYRITQFMKFFTRIGDGWFWFLLCAFMFVININAGLGFTFALLLQVGFQVIMKHLFTRDRPYIKHEDITNLMLPPDRFSFPSGHTAGAFAIAFTFWYFFPVLFIPFIILATMIAISRIYLGLHYPTDVLAGLLLGFLSARISVALVLLIDI